MDNGLQTEFEFTLPGGYVDDSGTLHKKGKMRLSTAADEIFPMKDPRVVQNPAYLSVILFARVIVSLGTLQNINPNTIEGLFTQDFNFLQDFYNRINENGTDVLKAICPKCGHEFETEVDQPGEV